MNRLTCIGGLCVIILLVIYTQIDGISTIVSDNSQGIAMLTETCERLANKVDIISVEQDNARMVAEAVQSMPEPKMAPEELVCLIETDIQGRIIKCSDGIYEIFGYTADEVINRNVRIFMDDDIAEQHNEIFAANNITDGAICERDIVAYGKGRVKKNIQLSVSKYTGKYGPRFIVTIKG